MTVDLEATKADDRAAVVMGHAAIAYARAAIEYTAKKKSKKGKENNL